MVFSGLLSAAFLNKNLKSYQWAGIFVIIVGLVVIGVNDSINNNNSSNGQVLDTNGIITGIE